MSIPDFYEFIQGLRSAGTNISVRNGSLMRKGTPPTPEQTRVVKQNQTEIIRFLTLEAAAEEFAHLYKQGKVSAAIDVMVRASYPCYADGVNDTGARGWIAEKIRRGGNE